MSPESYVVNFGAAKTPGLPCPVFWIAETEHYHAVCRECGFESAPTVDRWQARRWAIQHHNDGCPNREAGSSEDLGKGRAR